MKIGKLSHRDKIKCSFNQYFTPEAFDYLNYYAHQISIISHNTMKTKYSQNVK